MLKRKQKAKNDLYSRSSGETENGNPSGKGFPRKTNFGVEQ